MALTDNTTYTGVDAQGFYSTALITGPSKERFRLIPNVKSKIKLASFDLGNILADADCSFSGAGEGTLDQKAFEVCPIKINLEYCQRTFEANYLSEQMRAGSNGTEVMPSSLETYLLGEVSKQVSANLEKVVWQGDTATASYPLSLCDGLYKQMAADSDVIDVAATASITISNVVGEIKRVYDAIPDSVYSQGIEKVKIFVPISIAKLYKQAIANASAESYYVGNKTLDFLGIEIVEAPGMSNKTMVAANVDNLLLLTDLVSDFEAIQILPQKNVTGVPVVRMIGEFKFGVGYLVGTEIVYYA